MRIKFATAASAAVLLSAAILIQAQTRQLTPKQDPKKATWGYVDAASDKWIVKPQFDLIEEFRTMPNGKTRAFVVKKGKKGLVDETGKLLGPGAVFSDVKPMKGDAMLVTVKGKMGVLNYDGVYLVKPEIESLELLGDEGYIATIKGKKGVLGHDGAFVVEPLYKSINTSYPNYFVVDKGGKAGLLTRDGKSMLIEPNTYSSLEPFEDYWRVFKGKKVGLYDLNHNQLCVKPEYDNVRLPIKHNRITLYPVADGNDNWGLLSEYGKEVVKKKYSEIVTVPSMGAVLLKQGSEVKHVYFPGDKKAWKAGNYQENTIGPFQIYEVSYNKNWEWHDLQVLVLPDGNAINGSYSDIRDINSKYYYIANHGTSPLYNYNGEIVVASIYGTPFKYNNWALIDNKAISPSGEILDYKAIGNYALVTEANGKGRIIMPSGSLSTFSVDDIKNFEHHKDMTMIQSDGKWGIIKSTDTFLPFEYERIEEFDEERISLTTGGKTGLYNIKTNKWAIEPKYDKLYKVGGVMAIGNGGKVGLQSFLTGNRLLEVEHDSISSYGSMEYMVHSSGKIGIYTTIDNKWLLPLSRGYEALESAKDIYGDYVVRNGKYGIISYGYKEIVPPLFAKENITYDAPLYTCIEGGKKRYFTEDDGELSGKPTIINHGLWFEFGGTYGGDKACFFNFDLGFRFMEGREFILYCEVYTSAGSLLKRFEDNISASSVISGTGSKYFTMLSRDLPVPAWSKANFYAKFRLVDKKTKKEVAIPGNKRLDFSIRRG